MIHLHVTPEVNAIGTALMLITLVTFSTAGLITVLRPTGAGQLLALGRRAAVSERPHVTEAAVSEAPAMAGAAGAGARAPSRGPAGGLYRSYGDVQAVDGIDVEIGDGEFFSLIGPSGCGKTTTLRMIAGLVEPSAGRIEVHGRDVTALRPHRRPVNTVFQQYALFPHLNVFENVAFGLRERRDARAEIATRVGEMLELVGLTGREGNRPSQLAAASSSASRSPARWCSGPRCCCSTSRSERWT